MPIAQAHPVRSQTVWPKNRHHWGEIPPHSLSQTRLVPNFAWMAQPIYFDSRMMIG